MNTPSLGRIVLVTVSDPSSNNGAEVAPAVITRVWSDTLVNVRVLLDGHDTLWLTSVALHSDRQSLEVARETRRVHLTASGFDPGTADLYVAAYWPPRM